MVMLVAAVPPEVLPIVLLAVLLTVLLPVLLVVLSVVLLTVLAVALPVVLAVVLLVVFAVAFLIVLPVVLFGSGVLLVPVVLLLWGWGRMEYLISGWCLQADANSQRWEAPAAIPGR
ncbi:hypothetical protein [Bifidobacterium aesculapii]|uniref:hypothetical protein n=1 Tax=Bifidobacterium aesculapii TaxID=1329411 RepID=UPI00128FCB35|nr:hypothetical protein [Bifidobacterium aesculapii]